jgi:hypothetical protein
MRGDTHIWAKIRGSDPSGAIWNIRHPCPRPAPSENTQDAGQVIMTEDLDPKIAHPCPKLGLPLITKAPGAGPGYMKSRFSISEGTSLQRSGTSVGGSAKPDHLRICSTSSKVPRGAVAGRPTPISSGPVLNNRLSV